MMTYQQLRSIYSLDLNVWKIHWMIISTGNDSYISKGLVKLITF